MSHEQKALLKQLMEVGFVLMETNLYLDTHPTDESALRLHNTYCQKYSELERIYQAKYGPLKYTQMSKYPWQYIEEPWPWEIDYSGC